MCVCLCVGVCVCVRKCLRVLARTFCLTDCEEKVWRKKVCVCGCVCVRKCLRVRWITFGLRHTKPTRSLCAGVIGPAQARTILPRMEAGSITCYVKCRRNWLSLDSHRAYQNRISCENNGCLGLDSCCDNDSFSLEREVSPSQPTAERHTTHENGND